MPDERRQFRILYRDFLTRIVDLELLSARGDIQNLLVQFVAILAAFNFVVAVVRVPQFALSMLPREKLLVLAWGDQEFLISTTMAIAGLFAVLAWNAVFPDRRDSLVLGLLPVRRRTIALAKVAAISTALGAGVAAINIFTGLWYPFLVVPPYAGSLGPLRSLGTYWLVMAASGLFVCSALLAAQGIAAQLLTYRLFLRVSSLLQLAAFFLILGVYFLKPPLATVPSLTAPENQRLLAWLPSYWFLGLFQELNGSIHPVFGPLAARARWSLLITFSIATATYALAWRRNMRWIIEQPDITPGDRSRPAAPIASFLAARFLPRPLERAILLFTARTIARSRQHRLLLAAYGGIGFAIALSYTKSLLYGHSADFGVRIEFWAMQRFARYAVVFSILLAAALWARRRTTEFMAASYNRIQFEDLPPGDVYPLDLRRDGAWSGDEAYIDAADAQIDRPLRDRAKIIVVGAFVLVTSGFVFEQAGAWRDREGFPQIGRSVDIGGATSFNVEI